MSTAKDDWLTIGHAQAYDVNKSIRFENVQYCVNIKINKEKSDNSTIKTKKWKINKINCKKY